MTEHIEPDVCIVCGDVKSDIEFDGFLNGYICNACDLKREIGNLKR